MGTKEQFQKASKAIFKQAGNVIKSITYNIYVGGASDGMGSNLDPTFTSKTVQAFKYAYKQEEVARSGLIISPGDSKIIIDQASATAAGIVEPKDKDEMIIDSQTLKIISISNDPADADYFFQVRQK